MTPGKSETDLELATIIHDLRSPLTAILGYTQLTARTLKGRAGSTTAERALLEIETAARRMARMLDAVLAAGCETADGPADTTIASEDLGVVLDRAVRHVEQATGQQRVLLHLPTGLLACPADPTSLTRAIVNVVENALKYSPDGGPVVVCASQNDRDVVIVVRDPGIGIPAGELHRIFNPYSRASNARHRFVGTGLGLASARSLVESAGGSIAVASIEGAGTTVTIRLPLPAA